MTKIEEVLASVAARRPQLIDLSLDRVFAVLDRLGAPHRKLPPVFHVAGTNGKGSTVAFLRAILEAAGKSVHVYTSPHLVRFNERIVVAGNEIEDDALIDALLRTDTAAGADKLTYFETTTCAAFLAFAETPADYSIIEVGLGGRLDATNVFDKPLAAVVTPVDLDHQQFLGDTLAEVAAEKAGIFRANAPAVIGAQSPDAMARLVSIAEATGAQVNAFGQEWQVFAEHGRLIFQDDQGLADLDPPKLPGAHQFENAGLAIAALRAAGLSLPNAVLSAGLVSAHWPARMQRLRTGPLIDAARARFGDGVEVWLDGGHNPHAGKAVAHTLAQMQDANSRPLVMISGMQANKDASGYFENFVGLVRKVYAVAADHEGVAPASEVAGAASAAGLDAVSFETIEGALEAVSADQKNEPPRIFIGGSLYLAGEILRDNA